MDHKKVAQQVIDAVGRDNMVGAAHCATRLRLVLKDDSKIDQAALDANPDVKGLSKRTVNTRSLSDQETSTTSTLS